MPSPIPLFDPQAGSQAGRQAGSEDTGQTAGGPHILQLYTGLELFSEGEPPANSLFVLGRDVGYVPGQSSLWRDQLLVIDPPADIATRFRLEGDTAALFTGAAPDPLPNLPLVQHVPGGVAHLRVGEHFLDIYSQPGGCVVHLPATGELLGGGFGSEAVPPRLAAGSDGGEALDTLRLIARLLKTAHFQLFMPQVGSLCRDKLQVMERLAADVAYLHGLRRVVPGLAVRREPWAVVEQVTASLLPASMASPAAQRVHAANLRLLLAAADTPN